MSGRRDTERGSAPAFPWGDARKPRRDDVFELELDALEESGDASGSADGYRVRVRGGVTGARVRVRARRRRGDRVDADLLEVVAAGPNAVPPRCPHFGTCGGCSFQGASYSAQLEGLRDVALRQLAPLASSWRGGTPDVDAVLPAAEVWHYRNKMDFTFSSRRWVEEGEPEGAEADFALGLHVRGRHRKVLDLRACEIAFRGCDPLRSAARDLGREMRLAAWDDRAHRGVLRHLVLRHSPATGEILAFLVSSDEETERAEAYARELVRRRPEITTLVHGVRAAPSTVAVAELERVLHGEGFVHDELLGVRLRISPSSFFQTNSAQAQVLGRVVAEEAALSGDEVLYDVCCGGGAWGLALASRAGSVWGFELAPSAVADARHNSEANAIQNARFVPGDVARTLDPGVLDAPAPDVAVVDPPRAGLHPRAVRALRDLAPRRVVYVSCHLPSAVRDATFLAEHGYRSVRVRPVDLFPHTPHLECVLTLERDRT